MISVVIAFGEDSLSSSSFGSNPFKRSLILRINNCFVLLISSIKEDYLNADKLILSLLAHFIKDKSLGMALYDRVKLRITNNEQTLGDGDVVNLIDDISATNKTTIRDKQSLRMVDKLIKIN